MVGLVVLRIFGDPDDFEVSRVLLVQISEVFSDRVFVFEELLGKRLVDHGDVSRSGRVLFGNRAALHDLGADALKVAVT